MNDRERDYQTEKVLEMTKSLMLAISKAGGDPFMDFGKMTVTELISRLAPNNIRFVYTGPKRSKDVDLFEEPESPWNQNPGGFRLSRV